MGNTNDGIDRYPLNEEERLKIWAKVNAIPDEYLDILWDIGNRELGQQLVSRHSIRARIQSLMVLLLSGVLACLWMFINKKPCLWQLAAIGIPAIIWGFCFGCLFIFVSVRSYWTAWGSPLDNFESGEKLEWLKREKLFNLEETIIETKRSNAEMAHSLNMSLAVSAIALLVGFLIWAFYTYVIPSLA